MTPALLLLSHGTRHQGGPREMETLLGHLADRLDAPVGNAWLEDFASPRPREGAGALVARGAQHAVTVPFLVLGAGHAKTDVPAALAEIGAAHPDLLVAHGRVLGLHPALFALARERVEAVAGPAPVDARGRPRRGDDEALLVTASGSSDPDANGDLWKAARFLAEVTGHRWVDAAFAGVTWPSTETALRRLAAGGAQRVTLFSWSLLAGLLEERVATEAAAVAAETGIALMDAGRFGPDPAVADAVVDRYREALAGHAHMNCDLCQFRLPIPGREDRVGMPSAGGTLVTARPGAPG